MKNVKRKRGTINLLDFETETETEAENSKLKIQLWRAKQRKNEIDNR
jgi:hypothetical protein